MRQTPKANMPRAAALQGTHPASVKAGGRVAAAFVDPPPPQAHQARRGRAFAALQQAVFVAADMFHTEARRAFGDAGTVAAGA